ncbi:MAG TPA: M10 family metallopeptidase C-terminal domain-containing protein [Allosphingosinicella sp.]|nr:M10 family metallopeptidase C-terminal domain-containing protein [Allosphingosinicella sp.]
MSHMHNHSHAFPADGIGDGHSPADDLLLVVTEDQVGDGKGVAPGNPTITVGAPSTISTLDTNGDQDFFKVTLIAGKTYEIGMYGFVGGPGGVPLQDPYIELYRSNGTTLVVSADGGADTPPNLVNSGLDVLLTFEAKISGTYYINARAFDNSPIDGTNGEGVGDYELFVREQDPDDPNIYTPYYDPDSPLYAIDWGTQVDGTARNPDGDEGSRPTGNAEGDPDSKGETVGHFGQPTEGKNVIKIYFAKAGDVYTPEDPSQPGIPPAIVAVGAKDFEIDAVWTSLREFEKVADVVYVEAENREEADFHYVTYTGTPGPGISLLGSMSPPQEPDEGLAQFNSGDERWNEQNLAQGGFSFVTLIHEFGHGHGLAHPHDNGGRSGIMRGVEPAGINTPGGTIPDPVGVWPDYTTGDYDLNQGVHTMMSYEDGWQTSPYGRAPTDVGYGYLGGLMAFDIAVIQDKYGVNEEWATGNDTYVLKNVNAPGTYYSSIWDGGGIDEIAYSGSRDTTIDLRAATLQYEVGGGGRMSYADGIHGGFTIANGVTVENARTASGDDTLIGNDRHNVLYGGPGDDVIVGAAGSDTLNGGTGVDHMTGGTGHDTYMVNHSLDVVVELANQGTDTVQSSRDYTLLPHFEKLILTGTLDISGRGNLQDNTVTGNSGNNFLNGGGGNDIIEGGAGDDVIYGSEGTDVLEGGAGRDRFTFNTVLGAGNVDEILDFSTADDTIYLARYTFTNVGNTTGLSASAFRNGTAAADDTDRIVYDSATGRIFYDADGAGGAAAQLFATVDAGTALTHNDFIIYGG